MRLFALTPAALIALSINPSHAAVLNYVEPDDLSNLAREPTDLGKLGVGEHTISGTLSYGRFYDCVNPRTAADDINFLRQHCSED